MEEFIIKKEEHIQYIIENFDFQRIYNVMDALKWTWFDSDDTPTIDRMKQTAIHLLNEVYSREVDYSIGTGGFRATKYDDCLKLEFVIRDIDSNILNHGEKYEKLKKQKERNKKVETINNINK